MRSFIEKVYKEVINRTDPTTRTWIQFVKRHRYLPNFKNPGSFSEFIQQRKLYGDHSRYPELSDKLLVKDYVASIVGERFIIPTLWSGKDLSQRPESDWPLPFVVKANHGAGQNYFVRSNADLDWSRLENLTSSWLRKDWPRRLCEEWYNKIDRKILIEPMLSGFDGDLPDLKFFVFGGRVELIQLNKDRYGNHTRTFYSRDWEILDFTLGDLPKGKFYPKPKFFEDMIGAAEKLSNGFDFVRVDFYELPDFPKFGEMTFSPYSGLMPFSPRSVDFKLGKLWKEARCKSEG